jgi:hypothetical protein
MDDFDRQFNMWRNAARLFARTEFVMMLDVDFAVCTDFRKRLLENEDMLEKLRAGDTALVVPAFEYVKSEDGRNSAEFVGSKQELKSLWKEQKIKVFHQTWEGKLLFDVPNTLHSHRQVVITAPITLVTLTRHRVMSTEYIHISTHTSHT